MKSYPIPCGKQSISIKVPDNVPVQWVESRKTPSISDVRKAIEEALYRPIETPRLRDLVRPGQTVALVVTDITRKLPEEIMKRAKEADDMIAISREEGFAPGEHKALVLGWILKQARLVMTDCSLPEETLREIHLESISTLQEALDRELKRNRNSRSSSYPTAF